MTDQELQAELAAHKAKHAAAYLVWEAEQRASLLATLKVGPIFARTARHIQQLEAGVPLIDIVV